MVPWAQDKSSSSQEWKVQCLEHQCPKPIHGGPSYPPYPGPILASSVNFTLLVLGLPGPAQAPRSDRHIMTRCKPSSPAEKRMSARESKIWFGTLKHTSWHQSVTDTGFFRPDDSVSTCFMPWEFQQHALSSGGSYPSAPVSGLICGLNPSKNSFQIMELSALWTWV